jgi:hypothetical protein
MADTKKRLALTITSNVLLRARLHCIEKDLNLSEVVEDFLRKLTGYESRAEEQRSQAPWIELPKRQDKKKVKK